MRIVVHFAVCALLSALLWPFFGFSSLLIFLTGFIIDSDHLLWHFAKGERSIRQIYSKINGEYIGQIDVFHTIEFGAIVVALSWAFLPKLFIVLMAGLVSHYALDKLYAWKAYSIVLWLLQHSKAKKR